MPDTLPLLSGGIIGGFLGAFLGGFAKFFWEQWLPSQLTWGRAQQVEREKTLSHFRGPAMRAIYELQNRVYIMVKKDGEKYESCRRIGKGDYYITSMAYLIAQFFAWSEILREEVASLDYSELAGKLHDCSNVFSDGSPGFQIFGLEQREIGERMLATAANQQKQCIGYMDFVELVNKENVPQSLAQLIERVRYLMTNLNSEIVRLVSIQHSLIDVMDFVDPHCHWVQKEIKAKINFMEKLQERLDRKVISFEQFKELEQQAKEVGLLEVGEKK